MQSPKETIDSLLAEVERLRSRGEYGKCWSCATKLLGLSQENQTDPQSRCRIMLHAARSAYYVGRFDEAISILQNLDEFAVLHDTLDRSVINFEAAIVRANVRRRQGRLEDALAALEPYRTCESPRFPLPLIAERLLVEGACHFYRNEVHDAESSLESALGIATHCSDSHLRSRVLLMLGLMAQNKGLSGAAIDYFERAKEISYGNADYYGEAAAALNKGILLCRRGRFSEAEQSLERARGIFERIEWHLGVCRCLLALGNVGKGRREYAVAIRCYRAARDLAESRGFGRERALALEFMGDIHRERGRRERARVCYGDGLKLARSMAPRGDIEVEICRRLGELHLAENAVIEALACLRRGLKLAQKLGDALEKGVILRCMGTAAFLTGAPERGKALFRRAIVTLEGSGCEFELAKTRLSFAELLHTWMMKCSSSANEADYGAALQEAWKNAIEAGHLFGSIESDHWNAASERCIDAVAAERRRRSQSVLSVLSAKSGVTIRYSREFVLHGDFVAVSPPMLQLWEQVKFAAKFMRPVLITGETGTGKELIARIIHGLSDRADHSFVPLNCAAIPDHLFESEFFGHRRGCFTGALTDRRGLFEEAHRGTIFLDEVGELTTLQQVKLLRVLQEGKVRRIGDNVERPVDVRVITATNQSLEEKLGTTLRQDFFYRINAEHIHVPPLRERREDILPLIAFCLCGRDSRKSAGIEIEPDALICLQRYAWPGNVRELLTVLDRIKHVSDGRTITIDMLPERMLVSSGARTPRPVIRNVGCGADHESKLRRALSLSGGNKSAAAKWLGISRGTLYKEIKRMGLADLINQRSSSLRASPLCPPSGGESAT
jgi:DNA-binding NtrC family response regulator/tetratricopeptide (TPR) repeat protein